VQLRTADLACKIDGFRQYAPPVLRMAGLAVLIVPHLSSPTRPMAALMSATVSETTADRDEVAQF
jgi:hypothetical protein